MVNADQGDPRDVLAAFRGALYMLYPISLTSPSFGVGCMSALFPTTSYISVAGVAVMSAIVPLNHNECTRLDLSSRLRALIR